MDSRRSGQCRMVSIAALVVGVVGCCWLWRRREWRKVRKSVLVALDGHADCLVPVKA
jgi:hypothetical protein